MTLTAAQESALGHIRRAYIGPEEQDEVLTDLPSRRYLVGMLFPMDSAASLAAGGTQDSTDEVSGEFTSADVEQGDVEEGGTNLAEDWRPTSAAVSLVIGGDEVLCDFSAATYSVIDDDGPRRWRRTGFTLHDLSLDRQTLVRPIDVNGVPAEIGSRWRNYRDAWLVTVHVRLRTTSDGDDRADIDRMLFQVEMTVKPGRDSRILEYDIGRSIDVDDETRELRVRYRDQKLFGVGHGMAASWSTNSFGECTRVYLESVPSYVVPAIEQAGGESLDESTRKVLDLEFLEKMEDAPSLVAAKLDGFVNAFSRWAEEQVTDALALGFDAQTIAGRSKAAAERMRRGVNALVLEDNDDLRRAFSLGMRAMRRQMRQAQVNRGEPEPTPTWRPFQLGFILVSLSSTANEIDPERGVVDLIWFPTGGGKTEAYLALAAIEIFLRRIRFGAEGAGTAVITRYTLRLLTSQQFQRAAALICAMELLRREDERARGMAPFSIGLWIGNDATPARREDALEALTRLYKAKRPREANDFQITDCPWCGTELIPMERSGEPGAYGPRKHGNDVVFRCVSAVCEFFTVDLPIAMVDAVIYDSPPTFLLATVDKFARLQFVGQAGRLLGIGTPYRQPSLIIQDELHLLSGPLGTTVAVFDAVIQVLLGRAGVQPKIIASTATIRASHEQVRGLYGREVALYPPAGLDSDTTFFARPVSSGAGRLYAGVMPQSVPQQTALVSTTTPLLEIPDLIRHQPDMGGRLDPYWTLVMYHNSLRELGRSSALVLDDVNSRLAARSTRLETNRRTIKAASTVELTSMKTAEELPAILRQLSENVDRSSNAADVVLSSNMLSVGIDIPRLAIMLMVGQPKTTAEYIQATSRVGRGDVNGIVMTLFRSNRARDRSQFEAFRGYHSALYRGVEPTSVTPWSLSSRDRSLAGALVTLVRHWFPDLSGNADAGNFDLASTGFQKALKSLILELEEAIGRSDRNEQGEAHEQIWRLIREWDRAAASARSERVPLRYERSSADEVSLLKRFGQGGPGWFVGDSMRSVDPNVAIEIEEPVTDAYKETASG